MNFDSVFRFGVCCLLMTTTVTTHPPEPIYNTSADLFNDKVRDDVSVVKCGPITFWRIYDQLFPLNDTVQSEIKLECPLVGDSKPEKHAAVMIQSFPLEDNYPNNVLSSRCIHMPNCRYNLRKPFWERELNVLYCTLRTKGTRDALRRDWLNQPHEPEIGWNFKPRGKVCLTDKHMHVESKGCLASNINRHGGLLRVRVFIPLRVVTKYEVNQWYRFLCGPNRQVNTKIMCSFSELAQTYTLKQELVSPCIAHSRVIDNVFGLQKQEPEKNENETSTTTHSPNEIDKPIPSSTTVEDGDDDDDDDVVDGPSTSTEYTIRFKYPGKRHLELLSRIPNLPRIGVFQEDQ